MDTLLDLDGSIIDQGDGYWIKIEAKLLGSVSNERPHGVSYSLTLHDSYNQRILGFDNAHAVKSSNKSKYSGRRIEYDHKHRSIKDRGVPYEFKTAYQLLEDFFHEVDKQLRKHKHHER